MEDITVDYELKNALSFNDKEYQQDNGRLYYLMVITKHWIDIFAGYIADAWANEGGGVERFEEDVMTYLMMQRWVKLS